MKTSGLKYTFYICSAILLLLMVLTCRNAGISCDEMLHYDHSVAVYNYFASHGADRSSLDTPVTHLKYYGQSYDNVVTILTRWFNIDDVYGFRHIMSSLAGWLAIFITALFAVWLSGYRTGIFVLLLFAVSPTFMGHAQNNLKDVPFALSYIAGIFFALRFLSAEERSKTSDIFLLMLSIAFSVSIRAGGLLLICYLFLFFLMFLVYQKIREGKVEFSSACRKLIIILLISFAAYFLGILLWPFALQDPFKNVLASYRVMAHFPSTFRQIFEGKTEWSDFMPWYYLLKSMAITIPLIILAGCLAFFLFSRKIYDSGKSLIYGMILITILFPVFFAIIEKSNLYSSWRQFLFVYTVIVLISAEGFNLLLGSINKKYLTWIIIAIMGLLAFHPLSYMIKNPSFYYIYYNQFAGGLDGAHGNYETDYYYTGQTKASEWLIGYLNDNKKDSVRVGATYPVQWQFRKHPDITTFYLRNEERSQYDWDYAIITNRYIPPFMLKNKTWPPLNAIHIVYAGNVPVCAVLQRKTKADYYGYRALEEGRGKDAIAFYNEAIKHDYKDEMIFYNFARALFNSGEVERADSMLKRGLDINPDSEPILMYLGNISKSAQDTAASERYYNKVLSVNRKYFDAYIELSGLYINKDIMKSRQLLRTCLTMNPNYKPAIGALADTYRETDPDIAEKYDKLLETIK
jgi:tetratricopeptide (TPR) repeat protein